MSALARPLLKSNVRGSEATKYKYNVSIIFRQPSQRSLRGCALFLPEWSMDEASVRIRALLSLLRLRCARREVLGRQLAVFIEPLVPKGGHLLHALWLS